MNEWLEAQEAVVAAFKAREDAVNQAGMAQSRAIEAWNRMVKTLNRDSTEFKALASIVFDMFFRENQEPWKNEIWMRREIRIRFYEWKNGMCANRDRELIA